MILTRGRARERAPSTLARETLGDLVGPALLAGSAVWTLISADGHRAAVYAAITLFAGAAAVLIATQLCGRLISAPIVPWAVVLVSVPIAWTSWTDRLADGRMDEPFGYPNAQAAFFVLCVVAALMAAAASRPMVLRVVGVLAAVALAFVVLSSGSVAASILLLLPVAALAAHPFVSNRILTYGLALLMLLVLGATVVLGAGFSRAHQAPLESALTERRLALWHDALVMIGDEPLTGVGSGGFRLTSPTARSDQDAQWAHNDFLQEGAETGVVGAALLLAVFVWAFWRLANVPRGAAAILAAAGLAVLGSHGAIDYVLRFPGPSLVAAALVGWAVGVGRTGSAFGGSR